MVILKTWRLAAWSAAAAVCAALVFPAMLVPARTHASGPSGTVSWAVPADPNELKAVRQQISLFHTTHPTITVKLIQIPNNLDYDTKVGTLIAGGAPPDIYASGDVILPTLFTKGYAKNLTPYITRDHYSTNDFFQEEFRYFESKGNVYALSTTVVDSGIMRGQTLYPLRRFPRSPNVVPDDAHSRSRGRLDA